MQTITLMNKGKALPSVDVVIPTLNCRELLRQCLIRLKQQNYPGSVHIVVMDGGSTDGTPTLARDFGCEVVVREGLYSTGLTGARNLSLDYCKGDLYWQIDADNIIVDENVLYLLVEPFLQVDDLQLSIPMIATDETQADIDRYLAFDERRRLERCL
jgi:glycosyltransferase involved in cell wall biosynthesis